jgi:hypothetical protein
MQQFATLTLCVSLVGLTGCFTAVKTAFYEARGAKGEVLLNEPIEPLAFEEYQGVTLAPVETDLGERLCPPRALDTYNRHARVVEEKLKEVFPGGSPALRVESEILYVRKKGLLGSAQLLMRVQIRDDSRVVTNVLVNTESKAFREGSADDLAETSVDTLSEFLIKHKRGEEE